jgi:hypothetical protein
MKLNIPVIIQEKDSIDCGIAGILMILKYYKIKTSIAVLKKEIPTYEKIGTYMPQLGVYLMKHGFAAEIITHNPHLFTKDFKNKSQKELKEYFTELCKVNKNSRFAVVSNYFREFLEQGGKITVKIPDEKDIQSEIAQKRPLGAIITSNFLTEKKATFNFHFNVITGIDDKYIYINDPMWDHRGGKKKYEIKDYMYALHSSLYGDFDNGSLLKITKIKKR